MSEKTPDFTQEENEIIDRLGHNFSIEALTNAGAVMTQLNTNNELSQKILQIVEAIRRQAESLVYVLSGTDELAIDLNDGEEEGVSVVKRVGNRGEYLFTSNLSSIENVIKNLTKSDIKTVYTGEIIDEFLGLPSSYFVPNNGFDCLITHGKLKENYIQLLRQAGIEVVELLELK